MLQLPCMNANLTWTSHMITRPVIHFHNESCASWTELKSVKYRLKEKVRFHAASCQKRHFLLKDMENVFHLTLYSELCPKELRLKSAELDRNSGNRVCP
jgi:hypothetical protein